jgi:transcriptional regulator with XRE-family HTH domain
MKMSQKEMGDRLGKTQSQLSKLELRKTVIPFEMLESIQNAGGDVDYIVTGKNGIIIDESLTDYMNEKLFRSWKFLKEILLWIIQLEFQKSGGFPDTDSELEYAMLKEMLNGSKHNTSVMLAMRKALELRQDAMAEKLGINIKKFRGMEQGKVYPDAELLLLIYELYSCRPAIFLYREDTADYLLNGLWNKLDEKRQEEAKGYLDESIKVYKA